MYLVQRRSDGVQFVMKKMPVSRSAPAKEMESYHNEVRLLSELQHPGIVSYLESFLDPHSAQMCIIMSYCEGGDLAHFLSSRSSPSSPSPASPLPEAEILYHFVQMLLALLFMHDKHILHRDLKTANIFIRNGLIQLGDLGISKALSSSSSFASTCIGTPYYMSPELFKSRPYNHKSDVWALGCVLYEMCAGGRHAFDAASLNGLAAKIMKGGYAGVGSGYSRQTQQLIAAMLQVNPSLRPSVRDILCMPPVRRSLRRFVHVVLRHRDFWRDRDVDNFTRQIQRLGMQDMIAEVAIAGPAPPLPPAAAAAASPLPAAGAGMVVVGVGGRKDVRKALELLGEEEREKVRMEKKLAELSEMQAERERKLRDREKLKERAERRRSGGKEQQPALAAAATPAVAAAAAVLERRREEEQRRREEDVRRRRERERERERLRDWEKEKERQQREAEERRRRQAEQSRERERERRQREERERDRERAAVQVRVLQRERESERLQRRLYDEKAEQERQEMERIRSEGEELKRHLQQLQDTEEEEQGAAAGSEKERVIQRRERERRQREAEEMQRLRAARRDYREEKSRALERKEAVEGKRAAAAAGLEEREADDADVRSDAAREEEDAETEAAEAAERVAMEAGKLRLEQLTAHLHEYGKRLQTLRTTMQVTALIQESLTEDGDDDEQDEAEAADGEEAEQEAEAAHSSLLVSVEERMRALGRECVRVLGKELFVRLYRHIAECRDAGVGEDEIEDGIRQRETASGAAAAGDERWRRWRLVDQLLFMESHCDSAADDEEQRTIH